MVRPVVFLAFFAPPLPPVAVGVKRGPQRSKGVVRLWFEIQGLKESVTLIPALISF